jgi:hypothetical protein
MASVSAMQRAIFRDLTASTTPMPFGCTAVKVLPTQLSTERRQITVFLCANQELTDRMFSLPDGQYPLHMLMNHFLVFSAAVRYFQKGQLVAEISELMTATLAKIPMGASDPLGGKWGTVINTNSTVWTVPRVKLATYFKLHDAGMPTGHLTGINWLGALLVSDWPVLPKPPADPETTPRLQVVHVPNVPVAELSENQLKRLADLTFGYNNIEASEHLNRGSISNAINDITKLLTDLENAVEE